jgi:hypothetical protein
MDAAAWTLVDLGIVPMEQALKDEAPGVADLAGTRTKDKHWCTLCSKCLSTQSAYKHRLTHAKELQQDCKDNREAVAAFREKLTRRYGMGPASHLTYHGSQIICMVIDKVSGTPALALLICMDTRGINCNSFLGAQVSHVTLWCQAPVVASKLVL